MCSYLYIILFEGVALHAVSESVAGWGAGGQPGTDEHKKDQPGTIVGPTNPGNKDGGDVLTKGQRNKKRGSTATRKDHT